MACPGWTHRLTPPGFVPGPGTNDITVTAWSVPTTRLLVPANTPVGQPVVGPAAVCFLTGLGGPWGGLAPRSNARPSARIYNDPLTQDILITVTPSGIPDSYQTVEARVTCLDLSP